MCVPNCKGERGRGIKLQFLGKNTHPILRNFDDDFPPGTFYLTHPSFPHPPTIKYERVAMLLVVYYLKNGIKKQRLHT